MPTPTLPPPIQPGDTPPHGHPAASTPESRKATRDLLLSSGAAVPEDLVRAIVEDERASSGVKRDR